MAIDLNDVHRLQRLRRGLPGREQHPGGGQGAGARRPRDALDPGRPLLRGRPGRARRSLTSRWPASTARIAPCEQVCPVAATVHSDEGLNDMVYNRCVGTRYCANNCPYKVRRFNYFNYHKDLTSRRRREDGLQPRGHRAQPRGDGEVHLLRAADPGGQDRRPRTRAGRSRDGEIRTACQQACPTEAIVFGDLNDPNSRVRRAARAPAGLRACWPS